MVPWYKMKLRRRKTPWGTRRWKPFRGASKGTRNMAARAYKMAKKALPELHFLDNFLDLDTLSNHSTTIAASPDDSRYAADTGVREAHCYRLAKIAQGDGPGNRTGQTATYKSIYMKTQIVLGGGASGANFRAVLIQDNEPDGNVPAISEVLDIQTGNNAPHVTAFRNLKGERNRFRIIRDTTVQLKSDANKSIIKWNIPRLRNGRTAFASNDRSKSGSDYFVLFVTDTAPGNITVNPVARIRFYP